MDTISLSLTFRQQQSSWAGGGDEEEEKVTAAAAAVAGCRSSRQEGSDVHYQLAGDDGLIHLFANVVARMRGCGGL